MPITTSALPALPVGADTRSITERFNAVLKNLYNKILPVGVANTVLTSDGTTFSWAALPAGAITNTGATTFLANDVLLNNVANFFSGPNTGSIGAAGQVWLIMGVATIIDTAGAAGVEAAIFDGTSYIANTPSTVAITSGRHAVPVNVVVPLSAATTFTLRARDQTSTSGMLQTTGIASGVANKATSITAVRIS